MKLAPDSLPRQSVTAKIAEIAENGHLSDSGIFRNFEQDERKTSWRRISVFMQKPRAVRFA